MVQFLLMGMVMRYHVKNIVLLILAIATMYGCTKNGAGIVPTPVQIPIAVEFAGEEIAGNIAAETGKTVEFVVTDEDGFTIDPETVIAIVTDEDGNKIDYGTFTTDGDYFVHKLPDYFPNTESKYTISFYPNSESSSGKSLLKTADPDESIGSSEIFVSLGEETFELGEYTFEEPFIFAEGNENLEFDQNSLSLTDDNEIYSCYRSADYSDPYNAVVKMYVFNKTDAYSETWNGPYEVVSYDNDDYKSVGPFCEIAAFTSPTDPSVKKVAAAWLANDMWPTPDSEIIYNDVGIPIGVNCNNTEEDPCNYVYRYYVAFSEDGAQTFGDPIEVDSWTVSFIWGGSIDSPYANTMGLEFDDNGTLHIGYFKVLEYEYLDVFYTSCEKDGCIDSMQINTKDPHHVSNGAQIIPIASHVVDSNTTEVYIAWDDKRNSQSILLGNSSTPFMSIVEYYDDTECNDNSGCNDGTASLIEEKAIAEMDDALTQVVDLEIDRNGVAMVIWSAFMIDQTDYGMEYEGHTIYIDGFISVWDESSSEFLEQQRISDLDTNEYLVSGGKLSVDSSNNLHVTSFYIPYDPDDLNYQNNKTSLRYAIGELTDGVFTLNSSKDIIPSLDLSELHYIDMESDNAGRAYLIYTDRSDVDNQTVEIIQGNIPLHADKLDE